MGKEIERKFLVKGEFRHLAIKSFEIVQAYLSVDPSRIIRIRLAENKAVLSVKAPYNESSISRYEWEFEIPVSSACDMLKVCIPDKITKTRYIVPAESKMFEVDVFHGKNEGLIIAEIELQSEDDFFRKPDWLGEEVTGRPEFYNFNLI